MSYTITASQCGEFVANPDDTILQAGQRAGFGFPHACRNGNCERCLAWLQQGNVQQPPSVAKRLQERHGNNALLCCQAKPQTDCRFEMNGITAPGCLPQVEKTCQKLALTPLNEDVSLLRLRLPAGVAVEWYAGQYLSLRVHHRWLPFSIANPPSPGGREIEIHLRHLKHHTGANHTLDWIQTHDLLRVRLPQGFCYLNALPQQPLWFLCGSTGYAPAQAMLQFLADKHYQGPLALFWGVRDRSGLYLPNSPVKLAKKLPGLRYFPVLSDQQLPGYYHGNVHEAALQELTDVRQPRFFLSGSIAMVDVANQALLATGAEREQIWSDMLPPPQQ